MKKVLELKTGETIIIRHLTKSDVDDVWYNFNEVIEEGIYLPVFLPVKSQIEKDTWYLNVKKENEICIIAEHPGLNAPYKVIGQCEISNMEWDAASHVGVLGIIIRKKYRDIFVGRSLIDFAIRESKKLNNKEKIILSSFSTNERALHLFKKLGFTVVGIRKKQFLLDSKYIDEVMMELWIDDYFNENF
ncbi:MAG: GNAT family N-acetyltransferase [Candidatus Lokiarchaeota archaeon]|nr:GNAT family N-acetyltransferase [Candidatus Lokiarchaeota archaeon]